MLVRFPPRVWVYANNGTDGFAQLAVLDALAMRTHDLKYTRIR